MHPCSKVREPSHVGVSAPGPSLLGQGSGTTPSCEPGSSQRAEVESQEPVRTAGRAMASAAATDGGSGGGCRLSSVPLPNMSPTACSSTTPRASSSHKPRLSRRRRKAGGRTVRHGMTWTMHGTAWHGTCRRPDPRRERQLREQRPHPPTITLRLSWIGSILTTLILTSDRHPPPSTIVLLSWLRKPAPLQHCRLPALQLAIRRDSSCPLALALHTVISTSLRPALPCPALTSPHTEAVGIESQDAL